jgi:hypothetical protein
MRIPCFSTLPVLRLGYTTTRYFHMQGSQREAPLVATQVRIRAIIRRSYVPISNCLSEPTNEDINHRCVRQVGSQHYHEVLNSDG